MAAALAAAGVAVRAPMLPGHGTVVDDLDAMRWADWLGAAETEFAELAATCDSLVLFGLSMGGSLACALAAEHPGDVAGLVLVNPFIDPPAESFREAVRSAIAGGFPRAPGIAGDVADPSVTERGYDQLPLEALLSLCEGLDGLLPRLPDVTCPALLMSSRTDDVVPTESSDLLAGRIGGPVERVWLDRSWHVATLDYDRDEIERRTIEFVAKEAGVFRFRPGSRRPTYL